MFERFTDRARRMIVLAQEEARLLEHAYIGTEHVLLGLLAGEDGTAVAVLVALEAQPEQVFSRPLHEGIVERERMGKAALLCLPHQLSAVHLDFKFTRKHHGSPSYSGFRAVIRAL